MNLSKTYEPDKYEPTVYAMWETSGAFAPTGKGDPYSIVMPPPNANGNLHVGHAYMIPIEDILTRYYRMQGRDTIWIPGADHAGFETWVVFERALNKEHKSRFDYSREDLYKMTWDFVERNRGNMELQIRALGASCDWSSTVFTLDKKVIDTVYKTFHKLWDDGLVYRGNRIVNYCPKHQTSFADIEVVYKTEKSHLWHIAYPLTDRAGEIEVATTRPETMLGDVAIAVHPDDPKYKKLVGKTVTVPLVGRQIPIIADEGVELGFGTGAVKITPAHDPLDFEIGQRHNLEAIPVIGTDGRITYNKEIPEKYQGMTADEARQAVVDDLQKVGAMRQIEDFSHDVPHCYKCDTVIQPLLMKQWFINVKPLAAKAKQAVADGQIRFIPEQKGRELERYYDELRDWNISRQIPWGIPIPAFHVADDPDDWIFDTRVDQTEIEVNGKTYIRDEDTFDTWFSSGQWPFVTTDYLQNGRLSRFYPNAVMETGVDILRAWVARMVMLGLYMTGQVPFKDVFLHGLILDEHGKKMSKSKGNVVNPMEIIAKYGSDALRVGIVMNRSAGQAQAFSEASVIAGRNFCNKLWNIARYIENRAGDDITVDQVDNAKPETIADHWILAKLDQAREQLDNHIANYRFAEAMETIYHVIWDSLADWYIEASKTKANPTFMRRVLSIALRLVHPFAPFVSETIWTTIRGKESLLISQPWPKALRYNKDKATDFDKVIALVSELRYAISQLPNGKKYTLTYDDNRVVEENRELIKDLAKLAAVKHDGTPTGLKVISGRNLSWLVLTEEEVAEYKDKLSQQLEKLKNEIYALEKRLSNKGYVDKAPANLVQETRDSLADKKRESTHIAEEINSIS